MTRRVVILTEIISPYRIPVFNALAQTPGIELHVIFLAETDSALWQWKVYKEDIRFSYEILPHWRRRIFGYNVLINRGVAASLVKAKPDVVVCGGYSYLAMWQAQRWVRKHDIPVLLWSESTIQDQRRRALLVESLKKSFLRACGGFIVPGKSAAEYLRSFGIPDRVIFTAPNAVDNDFFATAASSARSQAPALRAQLKLPRRYFLFVGRMIADKGIFQLLQAYAWLEADLRERIGLVFAGDGPARAQCEAQAALVQPGRIIFTGFLHREELAVHYALAECLVFPTFSDTWGLVVNEAMACSLPVIVHGVAGCAPDLVRDGWNGRVIATGDLDGLASAMRELEGNSDSRQEMAGRSAERIANYTARTWAEGFAGAVMVQKLGW
jgi:glycosyltransferase involved in cell wall biosynthesis